MLPFIPALIAGVASVGSAVYTSVMNKKAQKAANEANKALWREQTAYNSPEAQMQRLQNAGLSPQLVYGQIADSKMSSPPTMQAARYEKMDPIGELATYQQVVNMQAVNELTRQQTDKVKLEAQLSKEAVRYARYENDTLIKNNALKSDSPIVKVGGRASDYIRENIVGPASKSIEESALWKFLTQKVEDTSRDLVYSRNVPAQRRYTEGYGIPKK